MRCAVTLVLAVVVMKVSVLQMCWLKFPGLRTVVVRYMRKMVTNVICRKTYSGYGLSLLMNRD